MAPFRRLSALVCGVRAAALLVGTSPGSVAEGNARRTSKIVLRDGGADVWKVGYQEHWFNLKTPRHHYQAGLFSGPDNRKGRRYFQGDDGSRRCAGFARKLDYGSNVVWMRFPRSCLKNPRGVRIGLLHDLRRKDPHGTPYFDKTSWGESKRLYRGHG